jgi:DNA repair exonuclease SbcCD ATPase subunit
MKKEKPTIEEFAAKIADKQDNPTIGELAKEFPEKTYKELENYRDADRHAEANLIPLTEDQKNLVEHLEAAQTSWTESQQKQEELEPIPKGVCMTAEMRKDRSPLDKMKRRAQEAEGELSIMKGIETNRVKEAQDALANALEVNESHQKLNGKLQVRVTELEEENKKLHTHINKQITGARKAGM